MNYKKVPFSDLATNTVKLKKLYTEDLQLDIRSGCVAVYTGEEVNCIDELTDDRIVFYKQGYVDEKGVWQNKDEDLHTAKLLYEVNRFIRVLFAENTRLKAERDKAVEDLKNASKCDITCIHGKFNNNNCSDYKNSIRILKNNNCFEWRGLEETE